jgi:hypothetical protein
MRTASCAPASWPEAIGVALAASRPLVGSAGVLTGGRSTVEDAYAYSKFARAVLGTDNIDFRSRAPSARRRRLPGRTSWPGSQGPTYADLETRRQSCCVAFEPEDESPIVFLRLRKAMGGRLIAARPGDEAAALADLDAETAGLLAQPGAVILVGERVAGSAGAASAVLALAQRTGAALAWVPRRAGERGALDAGALAGLLPGGRPLTDPTARSQVAAAWGLDASALPSSPGMAGTALLEAAAAGSLAALLIGGVELSDYPDAALAVAAVEKTGFVVSLENHHSAVTERADVVLPVAVVTEKSGTFLDWEGRPRPFGQVLRDALTMGDARVLAMIAEAMGASVPGDVPSLRRELGALGPWTGARTPAPSAEAGAGAAGVRLATWRQLIDSGVMQEGEPHLAATARPTVAVLSAATAAAFGESVTVSGPAGSVTLPVVVGDILDDVVWTDPWWLVLLKVVAHLRHARGPHAVHHLVRAPRGLAQDAEPHRPEHERSAGPPAVPHGRHQAGPEGGDHPGKSAHMAVYWLAPVISATAAFLAWRSSRSAARSRSSGSRPAAAHRLPGVRALRAGHRLDRHLRHRARRLVVRLDLPAAGRPALERADDLLRDRDGLSFVAVFLYAGSMSTSEIVAAQQPIWFAVILLLPSFLIYVTRWSARPTARRSTCPRPRASWSAASTPSTRR